MEYVCPLCNGLTQINETCSLCGATLQDDGPLTDYSGPYSPYEYSPRMEQSSNGCVHLLHCPTCGKESYVNVQNDVI